MTKIKTTSFELSPPVDPLEGTDPKGTHIRAGGKEVVDTSGLISGSSFENSLTTNATLDQSFTTGTETDVTGSSITFSLNRDTNLLFLATATVYANTLNAANNGNLLILMKLDGGEIDRMHWGGTTTPFDPNRRTLSTHRISTPAAGSHTLILRALIESITGVPDIRILHFRLSLVKFGK